jgi:hypothetical protein
MGVNQEKLEAKTEAYPERMKDDQEELETNQEDIEVLVEHCKSGPYVKAMHVMTTPQGQDSYVLHKGSK